MTRKNEPSTADIADRHRGLMALAFLTMGLAYLASATTHLVSPDVARYLEVLRVGMVILALVLLAPILLWKFRKLPQGERHVYFSPDGYAAKMLTRAHKASWLTTFLLLTILSPISSETTNLPSGFFLDLAIAVMLSVLSLVFLFLNRSNEDHEVAEGADA